jgi:3-isopropylmalate dehydratase small subunit
MIYATCNAVSLTLGKLECVISSGYASIFNRNTRNIFTMIVLNGIFIVTNTRGKGNFCKLESVIMLNAVDLAIGTRVKGQKCSG